MFIETCCVEDLLFAEAFITASSLLQRVEPVQPRVSSNNDAAQRDKAAGITRVDGGRALGADWEYALIRVVHHDLHRKTGLRLVRSGLNTGKSPLGTIWPSPLAHQTLSTFPLKICPG